MPKWTYTIRKLGSTREYVVRFYRDGKHHQPSDYFTNDKQDAEDTAKQVLATWNRVETKLAETGTDFYSV